MLFDFQKFIKSLRKDIEKKETVSKYKKYFGPIKGDIKDQDWYKEYVADFKPFSYQVPQELKNDFDWELLCQLVAASFSSEGYCFFEKGQAQLLIDVKQDKQRVKKLVSELHDFQILRLYEIYCEEMMNLKILIAEDDEKFTEEEENKKNEKNAILAQRELCKKKWDIQLDSRPIKEHVHSIETKILSYLE